MEHSTDKFPTSISTSSPECSTRSRAQQKSLLKFDCCLLIPGEGNARLEWGDVGESWRDGLREGDGGSDRSTWDVDDVSDGIRSESMSKGFSSLKASIDRKLFGLSLLASRRAIEVCVQEFKCHPALRHTTQISSDSSCGSMVFT